MGETKKLEQTDWFALIVQTDPSFNPIVSSDSKQPEPAINWYQHPSWVIWSPADSFKSISSHLALSASWCASNANKHIQQWNKQIQCFFNTKKKVSPYIALAELTRKPKRLRICHRQHSKRFKKCLPMQHLPKWSDFSGEIRDFIHGGQKKSPILVTVYCICKSWHVYRHFNVIFLCKFAVNSEVDWRKQQNITHGSRPAGTAMLWQTDWL